jgi:hypothetical protein
MSLSVKIVDNETGKVLVDVSDATCVMGAIARNKKKLRIVRAGCTKCEN